MARHRWVKLWTQETIAGTTFRELEPAERAVWFGFLCLAGDSLVPGTICASPGVPFTQGQLAKMLALPEPLLLAAQDKMVKAGKISLNGGLIRICNWPHYQADYARVEKWRQQQRNVTSSDETPSGKTPLPDQTRPEEEETRSISSRCLSVDIKFGDFCKVYESEIGPITGMVGDRLKELSDEYPLRWFEEAVKIAVTNGKRKLAYVEGVLKNYKADGFEAEEEVFDSDDLPSLKNGLTRRQREKLGRD